MWKNILDQCQPEVAPYDATQQAEGCYRAPTAKSDDEETKLNWVIILCALARSAFVSLNPSHAKKSIICEYEYLFFPFWCQMYKVCFTRTNCQYDLNKHFHDSDKMPKHVEIVRTKCQPKSWDGQNANHRNKSGQKMSDWHFVQLAPIQTFKLMCQDWWNDFYNIWEIHWTSTTF